MALDVVSADVYPANEVKLALLNVCLFSAPALKMLHQRRLAMHADLHALVAEQRGVCVERGRSGRHDMGVACRIWRRFALRLVPPTMEEDLRPSERDTFLHPVLDRRRYVTSMLQNRVSLPPGELKRALSRFRREEYAKLVWPLGRKGAVRRIQHKFLKLRYRFGWFADVS